MSFTKKRTAFLNGMTALMLVGCGQIEVSPGSQTEQIVGGHESVPGDRLYQASLQDSIGHFCGGALISRRWVLTAAHCVDGDSPKNLSVVVGTTKLDNGSGKALDVVDIIVHEKYKASTSLNDIALLKLASAADAAYTPLKLPTSTISSQYESSGEKLVVSGWGATRENGNVVGDLREVEVPVVDNNSCEDAYPQEEIASSMICAGYEKCGKDSCQGDSGGPLVAEHKGDIYSIGIVSWGYGCAEPDYPGVYTRTSSFLRWVKDKSNIDSIGDDSEGTGDDSDGNVPQDGRELTKGDAVTGLVAKRGQWLKFWINVPNNVGELVIKTKDTLEDDTGNSDIYAQYNNEPTKQSTLCTSHKVGNQDNCRIQNPRVGTYYIFLFAEESFEGVRLNANFQ